MADFKKVVMCRPTHFEVKFIINPWMGGTVDKELAMTQWNNLKNLYENAGITVDVVEQAEGLPDMVFICNAGLVLRNKVYLAHFRHVERRGEESHFEEYFIKTGYRMCGKGSGLYFEGGGDCILSSPKRLWAGFGIRTDRSIYEAVRKCLDPDMEIIFCELVNKWYYHLDTCFMPLNDKQALYYPPAFSEESQKIMAEKIDLIPVDEDEAKKFVCNGISIPSANLVILPTGTDKAKKTLEGLGWKVEQVDLGEFMKGGGAAQCLTLRIVDN